MDNSELKEADDFILKCAENNYSTEGCLDDQWDKAVQISCHDYRHYKIGDDDYRRFCSVHISKADKVVVDSLILVRESIMASREGQKVIKRSEELEEEFERKYDIENYQYGPSRRSRALLAAAIMASHHHCIIS